jgi:CHAT domain-containing protein
MATRRRSVIEEGDLEGASLVRELSSACERLAYLTIRGVGKNTPEQYRHLLNESSAAKDEAERRLAEKSLPFRAKLARERLGLSEVRDALPEGSALLAFSRYERTEQAEKAETSPGDGKSGDPDAKGVSWREDVPAYLAFVFRSGWRSPVVVPLGTAAEIEDLVSRWGQETAHGLRAPGWTPQEAEAAYREAGAALRKRVWDPIAPHLEEAELVLVVPDGALHQVSLSALPVGGEGYLIEEGPLIHYLSAERDVVPEAETEDKEGGILALGAPAFDDASLFAALTPEGARAEKPSILMAAQTTFRGERSGCGDFESLEFDPLPASGREIDDVLALWNKGHQKKEGSVRLTGAAASETAFKASAPGKEVLHLATHGFFLNGRCPPAGLDTPGEDQSRSNRWSGELPPAGENPLLLSGLAFAGANNREAAGPDEDDGILTAEEVAALDLSAADWVVLSACDTGIGEVRAGEGVFGLRRAFQIAGARTLITSLWPVEDEAGRQWMRNLYDSRFVKGMGTAESVRAASLEVLRQRRAAKNSTHPFYWAGFVASGDWR